jgi:UPF0176 protein
MCRADAHALFIMPVTNIAAYRFAPLENLKVLREDLLRTCQAAGLKGTILLSTEGINLFVAGERLAVDQVLDHLRAIPGLQDLEAKYSESEDQPFNRMLVRIKREIIAFGVEGIDPANRTAPKISPRELKALLDRGEPVTLLDTRNDYEYKLGTFRGAVTMELGHFRDFPQAARTLPEDLKERPVVMFCTGGIRCEKAGPYMEKLGYTQVRQLDGGILKYFEECGSAHYDGECFVFDQRVGLDPALRESSSVVCHNCLAPLTEEEQKHPHYEPPRSCPHCFVTPDERAQRTLLKRREALIAAANPLPGSLPYENRRPINVPGKFDGARVIDLLEGLLGHAATTDWASECAAGHLQNACGKVLAETDRVCAGDRLVHVRPGEIEPAVNAAIDLLHEDDAILVLNKPAPLPMHPGGRFNRNTLVHILHTAFAPLKPRPAHRLDANTTGLVVCSKTAHIARRLQPLFADGRVEKTYFARVCGHPPEDQFSCSAPIGRETIGTGCREIDETNGLPARTDFRVLERSAASDGAPPTALLEITPHNGRTNQIRLHLRHLGFPICGDPAYLADGEIGEIQTLPIGAPPLCLHARALRFPHPVSGEPLAFEAPPPPWA